MDRVILPTRAARTVRERVEARRAREHTRKTRLDRFYAFSMRRTEQAADDDAYIPPPEPSPESFARTIRPASSMARPPKSGASPWERYPRSLRGTRSGRGMQSLSDLLPASLDPIVHNRTLNTAARMLGTLLKNCLPTPPDTSQRSSAYHSDTGVWTPPRYASPGMGGSSSAYQSGRAEGRTPGVPPSWVYPGGSMPRALRDGGSENNQMFLAKYLVEFLVAVLVVAGLGFALIKSSHRPVTVQAAVPDAPTPEAAAAASAAKPVRIMLLGSDRRGEDAGFRTDVMMLLTIDPAENRVSVLSFPRDLVGKIPGYGDGRINIVMGRGGFELVQDTFHDSYGVRPDYYFLINFEGFVGLINSIGGVKVEASQELEDSCDLPQSRAGICTIKPGAHEMDGATALWYIRSRKSSSDFDRLRRAQEVAAGIFHKMISMKAVARLPELYVQYTQDVETNMSIPQIAQLLSTAVEISKDPEKVQRHSIKEEMTADWMMPDGARVLLPDYEAVKDFAREVTFTK